MSPWRHHFKTPRPWDALVKHRALKARCGCQLADLKRFLPKPAVESIGKREDEDQWDSLQRFGHKRAKSLSYPTLRRTRTVKLRYLGQAKRFKSAKPQALDSVMSTHTAWPQPHGGRQHRLSSGSCAASVLPWWVVGLSTPSLLLGLSCTCSKEGLLRSITILPQCQKRLT